jgi:hypothetical protein
VVTIVISITCSSPAVNASSSLACKRNTRSTASSQSRMVYFRFASTHKTLWLFLRLQLQWHKLYWSREYTANLSAVIKVYSNKILDILSKHYEDHFNPHYINNTSEYYWTTSTLQVIHKCEDWHATMPHVKNLSTSYTTLA